LTPEYLQAVQRQGWNVRFVTDDHVRVSCPQPGCDLIARFNHGQPVPRACQPSVGRLINSYDDLREVWQARQQELALSNFDVAHVVGCEDSYYAKIIRASWNDPSVTAKRMPNAQFALEISQGLGVQIIAVEGPLPPRALRTITDSRHLALSRLRASGAMMVKSG